MCQEILISELNFGCDRKKVGLSEARVPFCEGSDFLMENYCNLRL